MGSGRKAPSGGAFCPELPPGQAGSGHTGRTLGRERGRLPESGITTRRTTTLFWYVSWETPIYRNCPKGCDRENPVALCGLMRGIKRGQVRRGHVLAAPGQPRAAPAVHSNRGSDADNGRRAPQSDTHRRGTVRPQFYVRTTDVTGVLDLGPTDFALPGDTVPRSRHTARSHPIPRRRLRTRSVSDRTAQPSLPVSLPCPPGHQGQD
jgi:hypothetical protein